ncbi:MAG: copper-binding protein, partial [Verrucomicrobiota bacterium]|jgi:Cu/Ag efflux protein CusF
MKLRLLPALLALTVIVPVLLPAGGAEQAAEAQAKRHPLRGVVTAVLPERSAVMVKHEDIPGVMRAMTMAFKVDTATLQTLKPGDAITGLMSRQGSNWVLEDVKPVPTKRS